GLKVNDVLVKVAGSAVPGDPKEFGSALDKLKGGETISVVVLRKVTEETISGINLDQSASYDCVLRSVTERAILGQNVPEQAAGPGKGGVMTTVFRTGDSFTSRYQEGSLIINLTGTASDGKVRVGEITIQDGRQDHRYRSVQEVPARYRDKVNHLLE